MINAVNGKATKKEDKLFNFRPALFAAFFLSLGIVFAYYRIEYNASPWWAACGVPLILLPLLFSNGAVSLLKRGMVMLLLLGCCGCGFVLFRSAIYDYTDCVKYNGEVTIVGTVSNQWQTNGYLYVYLEEVSVDGEEIESGVNAYLPLSFVRETRVADRVVLQGNIRTDVSTRDAFGFRASAIGKGTRYDFEAKEGRVVGRSSNLFLRLRSRMEEVVYAGMDDTTAALTLALLTGDVSGLDEGLDENMRAGGISHLFAISGLNVGALYAFCLLLFRKTPLRKAPKAAELFLLAAFLLFYAGVCGFTASVMRATVLCIFGHFVKFFLTRGDLLNMLGFTACVLLLITPTSLFEVGFQLSFLACFGLVLLAKRIGQVCDEGCKRVGKLFRKEEKAEGESVGILVSVKEWGISVFSATLAAQIFTAPALLIWFGYLSGWSILLNLFFVPIIDGLFTLLLLAVGVACLLPLSWSVLLFPFSVAWSALILLFQTADFSTFALRVKGLSFAACVCYYLALTFSSNKWNLSKGMKRSLSAVCWVGFLVSFLLSMA